MQDYTFGPFRLCGHDDKVTFRARALPLGPKPVAVLRFLIERAGTTCTTEDLTASVWTDGYVDKSSLSQVIYLLRKTLGEHWDQPVIETVRNKGYRFVAPLQAKSRQAGSVPWPVRLGRAAVLACCALVVTISSSTPRTGPFRHDPDATRLYTLGRYYLNSRTPANVLRSIAYFEQVIQREPRSALAYAGLSDANAILADGAGSDQDFAIYLSRARLYADRAVLLEPNLSEAHASLAKSSEIGGGYSAAAEREFRLAIRLDPGNATAHHWFGVMLMTRADLDRAGREFETATHLDPTSPAIDVWFGLHRYFSHDYPAAAAAERQALDLDPQNELAAVILGLAYEQLGAYPDAIAMFEKSKSLCGCNAPLVNEARVYALTGEKDRAYRLLESFRKDPAAQSVPISMAAAILALGDEQGALLWLADQPRANPFTRVWLAYDPRLDAIRGTRGFINVTRPQ